MVAPQRMRSKYWCIIAKVKDGRQRFCSWGSGSGNFKYFFFMSLWKWFYGTSHQSINLTPWREEMFDFGSFQLKIGHVLIQSFPTELLSLCCTKWRGRVRERQRRSGETVVNNSPQLPFTHPLTLTKIATCLNRHIGTCIRVLSHTVTVIGQHTYTHTHTSEDSPSVWRPVSVVLEEKAGAEECVWVKLVKCWPRCKQHRRNVSGKPCSTVTHHRAVSPQTPMPDWSAAKTCKVFLSASVFQQMPIFSPVFLKTTGR